MSEVYDLNLRKLAHQVADENSINLKDGVYAFFKGPMYETPAEILAYKTLGADTVGMSTVPEAIVARHCDMKTLGISLITNKAAGLANQELDHQEVVEIAHQAEKELITLVKGIIKKW